MKTIIMAGGMGTRISSVASDIPKPMIPIDGKPVLEREIECLRMQGFDEIIITVSHLADCIINYFGDGSDFGVKIEYFIEDVPLGNAGALFKMQNLLDDDFLLLNADTVFNIDFQRFVNYHKTHKAYVTLFVHPNSHPYDSSLLILDENRVVSKWVSKEEERPIWYHNIVNAGLHVINPIIFKYLNINEKIIGTMIDGEVCKVDLDRQVLKPICDLGRVFGYTSPEYVKDMGTPDRYNNICIDYKKNKISSRSLKNKQKAIFLDRDGTINKYVGFLKDIYTFELLPGVGKAVKILNDTNYLVIVCTNQPVIARGEVTFKQLDEIHCKMETLLGYEGAYVDAIYFCPHHPDSGYLGEIKDLKFECDCRKPKPGMLIKAAKEFNIDLSQSWIIGDGKNDILAGKAAGCKTALIGDKDYLQDMTVDSLLSFANILLKEENNV